MSIKILRGSMFTQTADYRHQSWFEVLPPTIGFDDLFDPKLWTNFTRAFKLHDLVRVRAEDGSFDVQLTVRAIDAGGIHMEVWPQFRGKSGEAAIAAAALAQRDAAIKVVPLASDGQPAVRIEFKAATKWRVIGLNGELSRNHVSQEDAQKAMDEYLATARLVMPEPAEIEAAAAVKAEETKAKAEAAAAKKPGKAA